MYLVLRIHKILLLMNLYCIFKMVSARLIFKQITKLWIIEKCCSLKKPATLLRV